MDLSFRHDLWFAALPRSPLDEGRVEGLLVRPLGGDEGTRETAERIRVNAEEGVVGDRWAEGDGRRAGMQVSLINVHVLRSVAPRDADRPLCGDNLWVDLELSEANLPVGTRLHVGSAVLEVSEIVHRPCRKFHERFGRAAAQRVARANRRGRRGRGVLCAVVREGAIALGDTICVERPAGATASERS